MLQYVRDNTNIADEPKQLIKGDIVDSNTKTYGRYRTEISNHAW